MSSDFTLVQWNDEFSRQFLASTILQCLYLVFGFLGNTSVILIYQFKMHGDKDDRFFIPVLAVVDLLGCVTSVSLSLTQNVLHVMFPSDALCKALFFSTSLTIVTSLCLLLVISIHRYQKICKPFNWQMDSCHKYTAVVFAVICAGLLSSPVVILYGEHNIQGKGNLTGQMCGVQHRMQDRLTVYNIIILTIECFVVGLMSFLYFLVGKKVFENFKSINRYKRNFSISKNSNAAVHCPSDNENDSFIEDDCDFPGDDVFTKEPTPEDKTDAVILNGRTKGTQTFQNSKLRLLDEQNHKPQLKKITDNDSLTLADSDVTKNTLSTDMKEKTKIVEKHDAERNESVSFFVPNDSTDNETMENWTNEICKTNMADAISTTKPQPLKMTHSEIIKEVLTRKKSRDDSTEKSRKVSTVDSVYSKSGCAAHKYTIMFIVISFVAILTYIPPWIFIILETQNHQFWNDLTQSETQIYIIIRRVYILNHVANPIIYGMFDRRFRSKLARVFCH